MRRIAYGIVLLMFVAGSMFAYGCGGEKEAETKDLKTPPADTE
jgi:hypothetical protein